MANGAVPEVRAPSPTYATSRVAIGAILEAYCNLPGAGDRGWLTFQTGGGDPRTIQYVDGSVNLTLNPMDLPALLAATGEASLADDLSCRRGDQTLWYVEAPTPDRIARVVDLAFSRGHALGPDYALHAYLEASEGGRRGVLDRRLSELSGAGWLLLLLSATVTALVAGVLGPWVLGLVRDPGWRNAMPVMPLLALVFAIPGLLVGLIVFLVGRRVLRRAGVSTWRIGKEEALG